MGAPMGRKTHFSARRARFSARRIISIFLVQKFVGTGRQSKRGKQSAYLFVLAIMMKDVSTKVMIAVSMVYRKSMNNFPPA